MRLHDLKSLIVFVFCGIVAIAELAEGAAISEFYDENVTQSNSVDFTATGSTLNAMRLGARTRMAYYDNLGGVINGSILGWYFDYGVDEIKTLKFRSWDDTNFGIGSPSNPTPISGTSAFASSYEGGYDYTSFEFAELRNADPEEKVVEFGVTALSRDSRDYGNVEVVGRLADGSTMSATRRINEANGCGRHILWLHCTGRHLFYRIQSEL